MIGFLLQFLEFAHDESGIIHRRERIASARQIHGGVRPTVNLEQKGVVLCLDDIVNDVGGEVEERKSAHIVWKDSVFKGVVKKGTMIVHVNNKKGVVVVRTERRSKQGASSIAINKQLPSVPLRVAGRGDCQRASETVNTFFETKYRREERALHGI